MTEVGPDREQIVTASELVRQFGTWRERATRSPVYVLHRGRPRLILASVEIMNALCQPFDDRTADASRLTALLDGSPEIIVVADRALEIIAASRSVRARFAGRAWHGASIGELVPPHCASLLLQAAARVVASAQVETLNCPFATATDRLFALTIEPYPEGIALFARDITDADAFHRAEDDCNALDVALTATRCAAIACTDGSGRLDHVQPNLAVLSGRTMEGLQEMQFVDLFSTQVRLPLASAIDAALRCGTTAGIDAEMLIGHGAKRLTRITMTPRRIGLQISGLIAVIIAMD